MDFVVVLVVLLIVAALVALVYSSRNAVSTTWVESNLPPDRAHQAVVAAFGGVRGAAWTGGNGPGAVNMRRRGKDGGITMSIDIEPTSDGSRVSMWASEYNALYVVFVNFSGAVNMKKKAISKALTA